MSIFKYSGLLIIFAFGISSCKKDKLSTLNCNGLKIGLQTNDISLVSKSLDKLLTSYSNENLQKLTIIISEICDVQAEVLCFDCIYTLPSQSEIMLSFLQSGTTLKKVLDLSSTQNGKMEIVNMHD